MLLELLVRILIGKLGELRVLLVEPRSKRRGRGVLVASANRGATATLGSS